VNTWFSLCNKGNKLKLDTKVKTGITWFKSFIHRTTGSKGSKIVFSCTWNENIKKLIETLKNDKFVKFLEL
jgi:hypothetical protein